MHGGLVDVCVTLVELVGVNNTTQASGAGRGGWLWPNQHTTKHQPRAESATTSTHCQDGVVADVCLMDEAVVVVAVHGTLPPHHHHAEVVQCDHVLVLFVGCCVFDNMVCTRQAWVCGTAGDAAVWRAGGRCGRGCRAAGMVWHALGTHTTHTRGAPTKGVQGRRGRAAVCVVGRHGGVERGQHAAREPPPPPH